MSDPGTVNRYRFGEMRNRPLINASLEYLEYYGKRVERRLDEGKTDVSREHLGAIDREIYDRRRRADRPTPMKGETMVDLPGNNELVTAATEKRGAYLEELRARVAGLVSAGGAASYADAIEAMQSAARFAAQIASIEAMS